MKRTSTALIDVAEAAYNLQLGPGEWLPNLLEKGAPLFDRGLGCAAAIWAGQSSDEQPLVAQLCVGAGESDLGSMFARAAREVGPQLSMTSAVLEGGAHTASEMDLHAPSILRAFEKQVGCKDVLGVWAVSPELHGVGVNIPCSDFVSLGRCERRKWRGLAAHIAMGHRLRQKLGYNAEADATPVSELAFDGDALIDPKRFVVKHAKGEARNRRAADALREAAIRVDRARGRLGKENPEQALRVWEELIEGQWSLVDWFDTDGRRFVVAVPKPAGHSDPRGLNARERLVATYAAQGESSKLISYRLGVSRQRVSTLLKTVMRKLDVKTQPQLVLKMRAFQPHSPEPA